MSFSTVLLVVFVTLKLVGVIAWSWLWVLAPLWVGPLLALAVLVITVPIVLLVRALR